MDRGMRLKSEGIARFIRLSEIEHDEEVDARRILQRRLTGVDVDCSNFGPKSMTHVRRSSNVGTWKPMPTRRVRNSPYETSGQMH